MSSGHRLGPSRQVAAFLIVGTALLGGSRSWALPPTDPSKSDEAHVHAFRLYTGPDGNSHVEEGYVPQRRDFPFATVMFETTAPHSPPFLHNDPQPQYVVTMRGTLKFSTRAGEGFVLRPGDVLIAEDSTGTGHGWEMQGDEPWTRTYVLLPKHHPSAFVVAK